MFEKKQLPLYVILILLLIREGKEYIYPKTSAPINPFESISVQYLRAQPAAFRSAASERRKGTKSSTGELLKSALLPSATAIQTAIKAAPDEATALDSVAEAMEQAIR